jgi:hypothetical protein
MQFVELNKPPCMCLAFYTNLREFFSVMSSSLFVVVFSCEIVCFRKLAILRCEKKKTVSSRSALGLSLLTSALSLGVPVPRPTQCMGGV